MIYYSKGQFLPKIRRSRALLSNLRLYAIQEAKYIILLLESDLSLSGISRYEIGLMVIQAGLWFRRVRKLPREACSF